MKQNTNTYIHYAQRGFTIVELLIVVVIIAILAAITIVAYNGMQSRAKNSAAQSTANVVAKKLQAYYTLKGNYPSGTTNLSTTLATYAESALPSTAANISGASNPTSVNGTNTVKVEVCGAVAGTYGLGIKITTWDYTTNAPSATPLTMGTTTACATTT